MAYLFYIIAALCGILSLLQLRNLRSVRHQVLFFIFLVAALALFIYQLLFDGWFLKIPHLFLAMNVFALMAIILIYYYALWLADSHFVITRRRVWIVLAIVSVYAGILIPFWFLRAQEKVMLVGEIVRLTVLYTARDPRIFGISVFKISNAYFALVGLVTFLLCCKVTFKNASERPTRLNYYAAGLFAVALLTGILGTIGIVINSLTLILVAGVALSCTFCGLYVVGEIKERSAVA